MPEVRLRFPCLMIFRADLESSRDRHLTSGLQAPAETRRLSLRRSASIYRLGRRAGCGLERAAGREDTGWDVVN